MVTRPVRTRFRYVDVVLIVFGVYSVLIGLFMMLAPGPFFETLGQFGVRNDHYIFDNATFEVPHPAVINSPLHQTMAVFVEP